MTDEVKLGRPTLHKEEYNELIIEMARAKKNMYEIADELGTDYDTMFHWTKINSGFSKAYTRARTIQTGRLMKRMDDGMENRDFNPKCAALLLSHVAKLSEQRNIQISGMKEGTLSEKAQKILESVEDGSLTADELSKVMTAIATAAKIDEVTDLRDKVEKLEELQGK